MLVSASVLLLATTTGQQAKAGAWTFEEGTGQAILQASAVTSDREFGPDRRLYDSRPFDKIETTLLFEYGARDWLTLLVAPQIVHVSLGSSYAGAGDATSFTGLGYVDAGARARLWQDERRVVSVQATARISGTGDAQSAAAAGYENDEMDLRLLGGLSFDLWGRPSWLDVQLAQRFRFGDPPDELRFDVSLGVRTAPRWQLLLQSFNVISEGAGEGPWYGVSYAYYKIQAGAAFDATAHLTLQAAFIGTVHARNAPQENGVVLSGLYRF